MSQYDDVVERQRLKIAAEEWAKGVRQIHAHGLNSMWYDDRPQDTSNGRCVTDVEYNNGVVERTLDDGQVVRFGEALTGEDLINSYNRHT
jgi:hypothetical protein|tara:strand:+ start:479 stop:748 length:270 start_codon:yes stop_codon:yes gene_type:complete